MTASRTEPGAALPPAFPAWLVEMDPTLRGADDNPLFDAFRRRRMHARGRWHFDSLSLATGVIRATCITVYLIVALWTVVSACCVLPIVVMAGIYLRRLLEERLARFRRAGSFLPASLTAVFDRGVARQAALEIWLTGCTGREVGEALYFEHRLRSWKPMLAVSVLPVIFAFAFWIAHFDRMSPLRWVILGELCLVAWVLPKATSLLGAASARLALHRRLEHWGPERLREEAFTIAKLAFGRITLFLLLPLAVMLLSYLAAMLGAGLASPGVATQSLRFTEFYCAAMLLAVLGVIKCADLLSRSRVNWEYEPILRSANLAYNYYMTVVVMRDPDGEGWAWRCAWQSSPDERKQQG